MKNGFLGNNLVDTKTVGHFPSRNTKRTPVYIAWVTKLDSVIEMHLWRREI